MTPIGRPPKGAELVDQIDGSDQARQKLRIILETLSGQKSVPQACAELGIERSRFHAMRKAFLLGAVSSLEPRGRGRPAHQVSPEQVQVEQLQHQVEALTVDVRAAQIREELAAVMPHLLKPPQKSASGKTKRKTKGSGKKKAPQPPTPESPEPPASGGASGEPQP